MDEATYGFKAKTNVLSGYVEKFCYSCLIKPSVSNQPSILFVKDNIEVV